MNPLEMLMNAPETLGVELDLLRGMLFGAVILLAAVGVCWNALSGNGP